MCYQQRVSFIVNGFAFRNLLISLIILISETESAGQCNINPVNGTFYGESSCNGYRLQILTGAIADIYGSCGELNFTPPITGSDVISSVRDILYIEDFVIYPNPAFSEINILNRNQKNISAIRIFNTSGQLIKDLLVEKEYTLYNLSIEGFPQGTYVVKLISPLGNIQSFKFMKIQH